MENRESEAPAKRLGRHFSENLSAVLAVAGQQRDNGAPGPITATWLQQETGVARSTLRALKSQTGDAVANPDLDTLDRIAHALGVPPAFLLMRPQDWVMLGNALDDIPEYLAGATKLQREGQLDSRSPIERVMRECKIHPDARPPGGGASAEVRVANARDEWRRRSCLKFNALMLRQVRRAKSRVALVAIAGAWVGRSTPHEPIDEHSPQPLQEGNNDVNDSR